MRPTPILLGHGNFQPLPYLRQWSLECIESGYIDREGFRGCRRNAIHGSKSLFEKYQAASRLSIKRVIAMYTNVSLVLGNSS